MTEKDSGQGRLPARHSRNMPSLWNILSGGPGSAGTETGAERKLSLTVSWNDVSVCVSLCKHVSVGVWMYMCVGRPQDNVSYCSLCFLRQGLSLTWTCQAG